MTTNSPRSRRASVRLGVALALIVSSCLPAMAQTPRRVLLLFDEDRTLPGLAVLDRNLRSTLRTALGEIEFFTESLQLSQFHDAPFEQVLQEYYRKKYESRPLDLIVAVMGPALRFVLRHGDTAFPRVPIVFCGADTNDLQNIAVPERVTGLLVRRDFAPTLDLALGIQPDTRQVYVVGGTSAFDRHLQVDARRELEPFASRVSITWLTDSSFPDLLTAVSQLPPKSLVLYLSLFRDGAGQTFVPHDAASRISAQSNAPVYVFVDQYLGIGPVGGHLYSLERHGEMAGEIAARVLRGESPSAIPVRELSSSVNMFDARALARWGLDETRLPTGSVVRFREPGLWDRYKGYVVGVLLLMFAQTLLITGLLVHRSRRRRAETKLRASFERNRELGRRLFTAQEEERAHIARELHDDVSQQLAILRIDLQTIGRTIHGAEAIVLAQDVKRTEEVLASLRSLSHRLHPARLRLLGLEGALKGLGAELSRPGMNVTFTHDQIPSDLSAELTTCVFRVAQEALHNSHRHGHARNVSMHLGNPGRHVSLTVVDDGVGFDVASIFGNGSGLGLTSMRERVEVLGGTFEVHSVPRSGTTVEIRVPLAAGLPAGSVAV